jgi:hypothetical protein
MVGLSLWDLKFNSSKASGVFVTNGDTDITFQIKVIHQFLFSFWSGSYGNR